MGKPITVVEDCWIGGNVVVLSWCEHREGVAVGAGSVVTRDVGDFVVVAGSPARVIKRLGGEEEGGEGEAGWSIRSFGFGVCVLESGLIKIYLVSFTSRLGNVDD